MTELDFDAVLTVTGCWSLSWSWSESSECCSASDCNEIRSSKLGGSLGSELGSLGSRAHF